MRLIHLLIIFSLALLLAILHLYALNEYLLWKYWWMDMVLHALGGVLLGTVSLFLSQYGLIPFLKGRPFFTVIIFAAFVVSLWEVFEKVIGAYQEADYVFDTFSDIALGFGMALLVVTILWRNIHRENS